MHVVEKIAKSMIAVVSFKEEFLLCGYNGVMKSVWYLMRVGYSSTVYIYMETNVDTMLILPTKARTSIP